jgi:glycosyltransferase involved in cell wall biosynthesis
MKVAIVYDRVNKWGGAERVLLALHEMFPQAPLFTSVYSKNRAKWAEVFPQIHTSFLQKIPFTKTRHELLPLFMPIAFESFNFDEYDLVISITSEAAKGIITKGKTKHICYCLTPTRYLWSGYQDYFGIMNHESGIRHGNWRRIPGQTRHDTFRHLTKPMINYLRKWDLVAAKRPDAIIGISKEVQRRIKDYYDRDSELVYPPVEVESGKGKGQIPDHVRNDGSSVRDYFIVVSRLVPYKRVDLVIQTFNKLQMPLVIVGTGSEEKKLKKLAGSTIQFTGHIPDSELANYYTNAKAFIFPQEEDFGITAVEAQAHGVPVIAFKKGGALDTVIHGKTGMFFEEQTIESLEKAIKRLKDLRFKNYDLRKNARRFSKERFKSEFEEQVTNLLRR